MVDLRGAILGSVVHNVSRKRSKSTLIVYSPTSRADNASQRIQRISESGTIGSKDPAISKSYTDS